MRCGERMLAPMPRPKSGELSKGHVAVRLDEPTIARLEALLHLYALPGRTATRSDALRAVILAGLEVEERRAVRFGPGSGHGGDAGR
jgi:hypothetical protein